MLRYRRIEYISVPEESIPNLFLHEFVERILCVRRNDFVLVITECAVFAEK